MTGLPERFRRADFATHAANQLASGRHNRCRAGIAALVVLTIALAASNIASLLHDGFHSKAYNAVSAVVRATCGPSCLSSSPTETRTREAAAARKDLAENVKQLQEQLASSTAKRLALVVATEALVELARAAAAKADALVLKQEAATRATRRLVAESNRLAAEHTSLKGAHGKLKKTAGNVSARVAGRVQKSVTRKATTMVAQAIPYVGATIIWAVVYLDVQDSCDAMKGLAELEAEAGVDKVVDARTVCGIPVPSAKELIEKVTTGWREALQVAMDQINGDGRIKIQWDVVKWPYERVRDTICYVFGC